MSSMAEREKKGPGFTILLNASKKEVNTTTQGFKQLQRKLRNQYKLEVNKEEISKDRLDGVKVVVFGGSTERLETSECDALRVFMRAGGGVLVLAGDGACVATGGVGGLNPAAANQAPGVPEAISAHSDAMAISLSTNPTLIANQWLEEYGVSVLDDAVTRSVYYKDYFHPKEAVIQNASLSRDLDSLLGRKAKSTRPTYSIDNPEENEMKPRNFVVVYPFGCTLKVDKPSVPLLSSKEICFPSNRPIGSICKVGRGTLIVLGSVRIFDDTYLLKEDNLLLLSSLLTYLSEESKIEPLDEDAPESNERVEVPDIEAIADRLQSCLQEGEELPSDFTQLFDDTLYRLDTHLIPETIAGYRRLHVRHEPLTLIAPQFEVPLPPLQPAVFMPPLRELPPPALDLFDLDQHFATEKTRLAQLTNKCTSEEDLEYYVKESGEILGVIEKLEKERAANKAKNPANNNNNNANALPEDVNAKQILFYVLTQLVNYKKMDQDVKEDR
eukprot:TRINITY_DN12348_c0_g2_i5.p1 TRINITY_DN12348_c0_g2~~TRINITY_DN12348_c0_g2_i5.p1  ORF type:complete len:499 (-),score=105.61 TRINITY_DN12348_c0_g2_i5:17-1513(-)